MYFNKNTSGITNITNYEIDSKSLFLYPNPATDIIYINADPEAKNNVFIYSINGKQVLTIEDYSSETPIYIGDLPKGVYIVKLNDQVSKFCKL